jgi:hypothetical protein
MNVLSPTLRGSEPLDCRTCRRTQRGQTIPVRERGLPQGFYLFSRPEASLREPETSLISQGLSRALDAIDWPRPTSTRISSASLLFLAPNVFQEASYFSWSLRYPNSPFLSSLTRSSPNESQHLDRTVTSANPRMIVYPKRRTIFAPERILHPSKLSPT